MLQISMRARLRLFGLLLLFFAIRSEAQPLVVYTDFSGRNALNMKIVTGIITDRRGLLWVSTWGGLYRYDGYRFVLFKNRPGDGNELDNLRIDDVQQDKDGNLICQSFDDYYLYDVQWNRFRRLPGVTTEEMYASRRQLYSDKKFTRDGFQLKIENKTLSYLDTVNGQWKPLVKNLQLWHVNPEGVVWGVLEDGSFKRFVISRKHYEVLDDAEHVLSLHRDGHGIIWQANNDGSVLLRDAKGHQLGYVSPSGTVSREKVLLARVYCMVSDIHGNIILGTREKGLYVMTPLGNTYSVVHYMSDSSDKYSLNDNSIFSLYSDGDVVWVGTLLGGLNLMKTEGGRVVFLNNQNRCTNFPPSGRRNDIRSMTKVGQTMVVGTSSGVYTFKSQTATPEKIRFYHSKRIDDDPSSLASNGVMSVNHIPGKGLFICTSHAGICWTEASDLLHDNLKFNTWNTYNGAPSDQALQVFTDKSNQLWVIYETALSQFNPSTLTSADFMRNTDGDGELSNSMPIMLDSGKTLLASQSGVDAVDLTALHLQTAHQQVQITALSANGRGIPYPLDADTLELAQDQRNFTIEFAALEMDGNEYVEYAYRLEGRDTTWIKLGQNRSISFFNLSAGTYHLLIRATNNSRVWNQTPRRLTFIISPTFWETPWAWLLYALLAVALVIVTMMVVIYIYRLRLTADFERRMTDMRLRYFTDISHDLRTPLTLILGPLSELLSDQSLSAKYHEYLSLIQHNAKRMLSLTNQILDFSKIEDKKMRLLIERIDLKEELTEVMSDFNYLAKDHQIDLTLKDYTSEAAYIWGDKDKIQKIFFNLLSNAFKYTAPGKRIWIEIDSTADALRATVCDMGKGIPQRTVNQLFSRFETLLTDNYMKSSTGIGLSLVKSLVELHHAHLQVDSIEGTGSRFMVEFQKGNAHFMHDENIQMMTSTDRQKTSEADLSTDSVIGNSESNIKVMVVEDDAEMLQFVSGILGAEYQVVQATDGQDGLEKAKTVQPDLIVSDINMPRMNGWQMLEAMKGDVLTSHIPVVLLTANNTLDFRIKGAAEGVEDYISKPFSTEYLRVRLRAIFQKRRDRQQQYMEGYAKLAQDVMKLELPEDNSGMKQNMAQIDVEMMKSLKAFMEERLADNLQMQELADHVGLSRTLFYNKIRTITGLSPVDFYRKYHIERAAQMMRNEGLTVSEACYRTGFSDPKYFSKVFKKFIGQTPSEYRNGSDS